MITRFLKGTLILTVAGFVVKAIGSINWILLSRVLGGEGIGIYQMAFPIYLLALQISSVGIPTAISIMTAKKLAQADYFGAQKVFKTSFMLLFATGLITSLVIFFGAHWLIKAKFIIEPRSYYSLIALTPAIFFVTIIACYRGYLQGWQEMSPTAISQVVEQVVRVIIMLLAGYLLLPYGLGIAAGGASLGAGAGAIFALFVLIYYQKKLPTHDEFIQTYSDKLQKFENHNLNIPTFGGTNKKSISERISQFLSNYKLYDKISKKIYANPHGEIMINLVKLAFPISLSSIMLPLVANLDLMIVPRRLLVAGFTGPQATELFGYLTGMAVPLVNLATIFTASLSMSIIPSISSLVSLNDTKGIYNRTAGCMRLTFLGTVPFGIMLYILANPIVTFIYNAPGATNITQILAISVILLGIHQVSTGILQALNKPEIPVINMALAALLKVILNWILAAIPWLGIEGAAYATIVDIGFAAFMNLYFINKYTGYFLHIPTIMRNIGSALIMGVVMYFLYNWLLLHSNLYTSMFITALVGAIVYIGIMFALKGLTKREAAMIPFVKRYIH